MIVTIHQPEHLPWLGLIDKISRADLFVVLDTVQYRKNYFQNRNKIRNAKGYAWITVPVKKVPLATRIQDIEIVSNQEWTTRYITLLKEAYKKLPAFDSFFPLIESIIKNGYAHLADLNFALLKLLLDAYQIDVKMIKSSELSLPEGLSGAHDVVYETCKAVSATEYISGISGSDYLDQAAFDKAGIKVIYQEFYHPVYKQAYEPFMACMSSIDLLFLYGDEARSMLFNDKIERLSDLIL